MPTSEYEEFQVSTSDGKQKATVTNAKKRLRLSVPTGWSLLKT